MRLIKGNNCFFFFKISSCQWTTEILISGGQTLQAGVQSEVEVEEEEEEGVVEEGGMEAEAGPRNVQSYLDSRHYRT